MEQSYAEEKYKKTLSNKIVKEQIKQSTRDTMDLHKLKGMLDGKINKPNLD